MNRCIFDFIIRLILRLKHDTRKGSEISCYDPGHTQCQHRGELFLMITIGVLEGGAGGLQHCS